jgi:autophagy-related protein 2
VGGGDMIVVVDDHFGMAPLFPSFTTPTSASSSAKKKSLPTLIAKRDVNREVEIVCKGISMLYDSFGDGATALSLAIHDFEILDHVRTSPVKKLFQHWENEKLHPRYTAADMVRFNLDVSARGNHQMKTAFLPVRLVLNQDTLELIFSFSTSPIANLAGAQMAGGAADMKKSASPVSIELCDFRALKLKIDYYPNRVDMTKLKEGRYTELVNLFSYEGMEVALKRAEFRNLRGFDELATALTEYWAQDIFNKQLYQLLAGISPAIKNVATDMADIVLLPVDLFRGKASSASVGKKAQHFAKTIVVEGCGIGKKVTSAALNLLDDKRTRRVPTGMPDGVNVAAQAVASRAKSVHHTIIAVPLATWQREGTTGALKSVIRAIPVAVIQPVLGLGEAIEAISSGIQFHIEPEEYKEETRRWKS